MTSRSPADRATEALWRHVESNLHRQNASDAIPQLRQILACQVEATEPQGRFVRRPACRTNIRVDGERTETYGMDDG